MKYLMKLLTGLLVLGISGTVSATPTYWESDFGTESDLSHRDDDYEDYDLGFDFTFYGESFDSVWVNSNGALHFDNSADQYEVSHDIEDSYGRTIAPFWADLDPSEGGEIYYNSIGSSHDRRFVVTWDDVSDYDEEFDNTFQVVLYEDGLIQFGYDSLLGSGDDDSEDVIGVSQGDGSHYNYFTAADGDDDGIYPDGLNLFYVWNAATDNYDVSETHPAAVPEPSTLLLFGAALMGFAGTSARRKKKA